MVGRYSAANPGFGQLTLNPPLFMNKQFRLLHFPISLSSGRWQHSPEAGFRSFVAYLR